MTYTPEEIKEHRAQWLAALRSGEYKQTVGILARKEDDGTYSYCCLGVLCDLAGIEFTEEVVGSVAPTTRKKYGKDDYRNGFYPDALTLPREAKEWLGVDVDAPCLLGEVEVEDSSDGPVYYDSLTELNDNAGFTFEQIADAIEQHGLPLYVED